MRWNRTRVIIVHIGMVGRVFVLATLMAGCSDRTPASDYPTTDMSLLPASDMAHTDLSQVDEHDMDNPAVDMAERVDMAEQQSSADMTQLPDLAQVPDMSNVCTGVPLGSLCDGATMCCRGICGHIGGIIYECCLPANNDCADGSECCSKGCAGHKCV